MSRRDSGQALQALRALPGRIDLVSASTYVVNCFKQCWYAKWQKNGWRESQNKPVVDAAERGC